MREASIEKYLCAAVKRAGGLAPKLSPFGLTGIPDRLILLPGGALCFVELKRPDGGKLGKLQGWWAGKLTALGFRYARINTKQAVDELVKEMTHGRP